MKAAIQALLFISLLCGPMITRPTAQEIPPYKPGGAVSAPRLLKEVKPAYPVGAMKSKVAGVVELECVVRTDGTPGDIRVTRALDPTLDAEAIKALEQWRFKPGEKDGVPVPVVVNVEMSFKLRDKGVALPAQTNTEPAAPAARTPGVEALLPPGVYKPGNGVSEPVLVSDAKPRYSAAAMRDRIQGRVTLKCIVLPDGSVGDVHVSQSLDPELDEEAIRTVRLWKFKPGMKDGQPVPVQVLIEMAFTMK